MLAIADFVSRFALASNSYTFWWFVLVSAAVAVVLNFVISFVQQRRIAARSVAGVPGPAGHWLKGHMDYARFDGDGLKFHLKCTIDYKTCYSLWFGPLKSLVVLCHPDTIKVIQSSNAPKERFVYNLVRPFIGDGLVVSEGDKWFRMRRLLTPAFHFEILKPYARVFQESTNVLLEKWSSQGSGEVELFHHVSLMTLDSVLKCALSYRSNCQTQEKKDPYIIAVYEASNQILTRLINPLLHNDYVYKWTPEGRKFYKNCDIAHAKADGIIKARRKALQDNAEKEKLRKRKYLDFVDILLEAKDEDGNGLTDEEIVGEAMTFMFAGHDTTASVIAWTLYNLARFPEHQEKCRQEVDEVFGHKEELEWKELGRLKYLHMCVKETTRIFAPVPVISRTLDKTYEIDGHLLPEGSWVMTNVYALHHNPHVWKDPETFDPLRFTPENSKDMSPYAFIPFSAGPRNCIGQSFALGEVKLSLAMILRKFKLSVGPDGLVPVDDLIPELILRAKNGIRVNISPRV
ncbi:cytochrome P450 4F1-like isoform X3 [Oculina patagonica]